MKKKRKNKYKSIITQRILKSTHKIGVCVSVACLFFAMLIMHGTNAGFLDEEKTSSAMAMGTLNTKADYSGALSAINMVPGVDPLSSKDVTFSNTGSLNLKYGVKYARTGGDSELCDALLLTAKKGATTVYNKQLLKNFDIKNFSGSDFAVNVSASDSWNFTVELPENAGNSLEKKTCKFNLDFTAWQTANVDGSIGFTAKKTFGENSIQTGEWAGYGDVVINEVMWMGSDTKDGDEWLELRNMTDQSINLSSWQLTKKNSSNVEALMLTIPSGKTISPNGFFLISEYDQAHSAINVAPDLVIGAGDTNGEEFALANTDLQIKLYKGNWTGGANLIDTADDGHGNPLVGNNSSGLNQSMERNNIPGDGTLSASWHTCVSGDANSLSYWDAIGNNYGTPGAANLSSVVMNEFIVNPAGGGDQWVELYNLLDEDFDVSGWYFKNNDGDKIIISESNTESGKTTVPGKGMLVVNLGKDFLDSSKDTLSFYDDMKTADDEDDDVREDVYKYENSTKEAGDSFMRVPDGIGIWIDPEATPGEKNKLTDKESDGFRLLAYDKCFDGEKLKKKNKDEICAPIFLQYIDMIKDVDDEKIKDSTLIKILEVKKTDEEKKLADLLKESEVISAETPILPETKPEEQEKVVTQEPIIDNSIKNENEGQI